ncbi:MAG: caspase family protein [Rhizobiaceae bacterium]
MRASRAIHSFIIGLCLVVAGVTGAAAEKRVALVVGNSEYEHIPRLTNPANDAADLTEKLKALGFELFGGVDRNKAQLESDLIQFGRATRDAEVALFFYAGHGIQVDGENYLVPVDARVEFEDEIDISLVGLSTAMRQLQRGSRTNIVFLDACRDNPFADKLAASSNRSAMSLKGLSRVQSGRGTFIAYATQPDAVASDGAGRNSPFTAALLKHIDTPGQTISDMMIEVRNEVIEATNNAQIPWDSSSLTGRFSFAAAEPGGGTGDRAAPASGGEAPDREAYEFAMSVDTCGAYEAVIRRFPGSFYADLARERSAAVCATAGAVEPEAETALALAAPETPEEPLSATRTLSASQNCKTTGGGVSYCATSVLAPQGKNSYGTDMLFDANRATAWVESDDDAGIGQSIVLQFDDERVVSGIDILNGYDKDEKTWTNNSRVRGATVALSSGATFQIELPDVRDYNRFTFSRPVKTRSLSITIDSVYRGARFADTAISELYPLFED